MVDLIVAFVAGLALVGMVVIVARKFPTLASVDTSVIPAERHDRLKSRLIEQRFRRKLSVFFRVLGLKLRPFGTKFVAWLRQQYGRLLDLEEKYRTRARVAAVLTPDELEKKGHRIEAILGEARDALRREEYAEAERKAIEAVSVDPKNVEAYRVLAAVYLGQHDYEHARETLQFVIERLHVEDDELYAELGLVASGEGNLEVAKQHLEKSIALNGQVAQHHLDLCRVNLSLGDSGVAFNHCQRAVDLEPNNPKFLDALIETSILTGKRDWARETLGKLRSVNPENQKLSEFASRIENMRASKRYTESSHSP